MEVCEFSASGREIGSWPEGHGEPQKSLCFSGWKPHPQHVAPQPRTLSFLSSAWHGHVLPSVWAGLVVGGEESKGEHRSAQVRSRQTYFRAPGDAPVVFLCSQCYLVHLCLCVSECLHAHIPM